MCRVISGIVFGIFDRRMKVMIPATGIAHAARLSTSAKCGDEPGPVQILNERTGVLVRDIVAQVSG